jgi:PTS system galactitol-specific IIC component
MMEIVNYIRNVLGNTVVLPIVIFLLSLLLGLGLTKALRAGMLVGIGIISINAAVGLMMGALEPASIALVERTGLKFSTFDLGWVPAAGIAFGTLVGTTLIPFVFGLNIIMLFLRMTKTFNVDIWNYWHLALSGSMVYFITGGNYWAGILAALTHAVYSLLIADATAPKIQEFLGLPGISISHGWATTSVPLILGLNWIFDRIPGIRDIDIDMDGLKKRIGLLGEPFVLGAILGIIIGIGAGMEFGGIAKLTMILAAAMLLFPRMVAILIEGLSILSKGAQEFFHKKLKGRETYVGLDSAVLLGYPGTIVVGVLLVPVTIILAAILPGNTVMPFADLAWCAFFIPMCAPLLKGNMFRTLITGIFTMAMVLYIATIFAPAITSFAPEAGVDISAAAGFPTVTGLSAGNLVALILYQISKVGSTVSMAIAFVISLIVAAVVAVKRVRSERAVEA